MLKKNKTCIVYIITKLELGGAQKICLSLFHEITNYFDTFLISGSEGTLVNDVKHIQNTYLLPDLKREVSLKNIWREIKAFLALIKQLKQLKKDYNTIIVHTHSTKAGVLGRWAAWFAGIKIRVHTIHGFCFHPHQNKLTWFIYYMLETITCLITTQYICVSQVDSDIGKKVLPFFKHKHILIRAAIPLEKFKCHKMKKCSSMFVFGTIACFKKQKNIFDLLKAFNICYQQNNHTRLELIGDGYLRTEIESWIHTNNLTHAIILHGWKEDVASIMQTWQAFALTSLWEGLPCAIVEARSLQLPVIAYNTGGISDIIFHEQNGLLCKQKDMDYFAYLMMRIMQDQNLYKKLQSFPDDLREFDQTNMLQRHIKFYNSMRL